MNSIKFIVSKANFGGYLLMNDSWNGILKMIADKVCFIYIHFKGFFPLWFYRRRMKKKSFYDVFVTENHDELIALNDDEIICFALHPL